MKKYILLTFMFLGILNFAQTQKVKFADDKKFSFVTYSMRHPMHDWTGTSKDVTSIIVASKDKTTVEKLAVSIKISSFDSQNANRDSHVMEVLEAIKYPNVSFYSTSIKKDGEKISIAGILNLHGVEKPIIFNGIEKLEDHKLQISGSFTVKITDFKLKRPSIMGMETEDEIKINLRLVY